MIYKIRNINYYGGNYLKSFYNYIYTAKKLNISKYRRIDKISSSIVGEIILSELINENFHINYSDLTFEINDYGKPYVSGNQFYYNISHSFEYIITTISNNEIGVDIEKIRETSIKNIRHFATDKEQLYILSSNNDIEKRLFQIYTLKEAYFKMKGSNLNMIKDVEFTINDDIVICSDKNVSAYFINDMHDYVIAICENKRVN